MSLRRTCLAFDLEKLWRDVSVAGVHPGQKFQIVQGSEEVISRRDHSARNLSETLALNEFSSTAWEVPRSTHSGTQGKF